MAISPKRLTIYLYSAHRAVIFAIAQLSCQETVPAVWIDENSRAVLNTSDKKRVWAPLQTTKGTDYRVRL